MLSMVNQSLGTSDALRLRAEGQTTVPLRVYRRVMAIHREKQCVRKLLTFASHRIHILSPPGQTCSWLRVFNASKVSLFSNQVCAGA